jgi:hypothetical protein
MGMRYQKHNDEMRCSFCRKSHREVKKLIAGLTIHICNECIELMVSVTYYSKAQEKIFNNDPVAETETVIANYDISDPNRPLTGVVADADKDEWTPEIIERTAHHTTMSYLISAQPSKEWLNCFWQMWRVRVKGKFPKPEIRFEDNMIVVITSPNKARAYEKMIAECIGHANKMRGN